MDIIDSTQDKAEREDLRAAYEVLCHGSSQNASWEEERLEVHALSQTMTVVSCLMGRWCSAHGTSVRVGSQNLRKCRGDVLRVAPRVQACGLQARMAASKDCC